MGIQNQFKNHLEGIIVPNRANEAKHWVWLLHSALNDVNPVEQARFYGFDYVRSDTDIYRAIAYLSGVVARSA